MKNFVFSPHYKISRKTTYLTKKSKSIFDQRQTIISKHIKNELFLIYCEKKTETQTLTKKFLFMENSQRSQRRHKEISPEVEVEETETIMPSGNYKGDCAWIKVETKSKLSTRHTHYFTYNETLRWTLY